MALDSANGAGEGWPGREVGATRPADGPGRQVGGLGGRWRAGAAEIRPGHMHNGPKSTPKTLLGYISMPHVHN